MRIGIEGRDQRPLYLVLGENWYKDWRATIDGADAPVLRAQHTLLSVVVPPGAREVAFEFRSPEFARGKLISLVAILVALAMIVLPRLRPRPAAHG
jgi:Predicted membrane protein